MQHRLTVDHIGIAVRDIGTAVKEYELLGFRKLHDSVIEGKTQEVRAQFMRNGTTTIELLEPLDKESKSELDSYLKTPLYKMYHICYESENFDSDVEYLMNTMRARKIGGGNLRIPPMSKGA